MIKFTDVCKAYIRYWYVILVSVILALGLVLVVTNKPTSYTAKSILIVEKNETVASNEFITSAYAESVIQEMQMRIMHTEFIEKAIERIDDEELQKSLTPDIVKQNIRMSHDKGAMFFEIFYAHTAKDKAQTIVDTISKTAIDEYDIKVGTKAQLSQVYSPEIYESNSKTLVYAIIGILIGGVLGVVLVTFFVVFNPFVENRELLEKECAIPVLATLNKRGGKKNED